MPILGKGRNPFQATQQNGEQVDAVRSKIASLMDGVTERGNNPQGATARPDAAPEPTPPTADDAPSWPRPYPSVPVGGITAPPFSEQTAGVPAIEEPALMATGLVNIKGRAGAILIEIGNGPWPQLFATLTERLASAGNFFRNGKAALAVDARPMAEAELRQVVALLAGYALELALIKTTAPETFQVALALGLAAQLESADGQPTASAQPALANLSEEQHFVYCGHLRAGQVLQRREHIIVVGDVNPGATIISDGDILVWGHLRGVAHAGNGGDLRAVIVALDLTPVQLRVADFIAIAPEPKEKRGWGRNRSPAKQPEIAYLAHEQIVVEPWDASKFGGIASFRRKL